MNASFISSVNSASVNSNPLEDSSTVESGSVKLRLEVDDPYIGFEEFPPLQEEQSEEEDVAIAPQEAERELDERDAEIEGESGVVDKLRPFVGMEFCSADEAYNFYNTYAGHTGFSIRKNNQQKSRNGLSFVRYVCNKEGLSKRQKAEQMDKNTNKECKSPEREYGTTRTNCRASLSAKLNKKLKWEVTIFNEEHNHTLLKSPSKKRNMRSQKCLTLEDVEIIRDLSAQNVGTSRIYEFIASKRGGKSELHFKKKDVSNQVSSHNKKFVGVDVETTLYYFRKRQEEDPQFFYAIDVDEEGRARHIFWVDGRARRAYLEFGDVITFDTTYNTNRYSMPVAPFIGVNHHRHSIFFGMALIRSEKEWNFSWLFETWLSAMHGKHPVSIITDQDPAMKIAIKKIFPNTLHRCCQWHVMRKAREKFLRTYAENPGLEKELKNIINRSLTVADFEEGWNRLFSAFKIENSGHWRVMYDCRSEWVPAFFRDTFFAEMSTTQRSESMNAMLKLWVHNHTSIYQFVQKIEMMIEGIWHKESDEDIKNIHETPRLWSLHQIEGEARDIYTRKNFAIFKEILRQSFLGVVIEHEREKTYEVRIKVHPLIRNWKAESFIVQVDKAAESFSCNCKGFEFEGFLCPHALKVLLHVGFEHLPQKYIMHRWCKGANENTKRDARERGKGSDAVVALRRSTLRIEYNEIEEFGSASAASFEIALSKMKELKEELKPFSQSELEQIPLAESENRKEGYLDPPLSQCKGRKKRPVRWKPTIEKSIKKGRTCSYCHTKEAHNIRTCPKRMSDVAKGKKQLEAEEGEEEDEEEGEEEGEEESAA